MISFGVQRADGLQLSSYDGKDYFPITQADIPAGAPVVYVPADVVLSSSKAAQEFGEHLAACEAALVENGMEDRLPLFRVFFKVLGNLYRVLRRNADRRKHVYLISLPPHLLHRLPAE